MWLANCYFASSRACNILSPGLRGLTWSRISKVVVRQDPTRPEPFCNQHIPKLAIETTTRGDHKVTMLRGPKILAHTAFADHTRLWGWNRSR